MRAVPPCNQGEDSMQNSTSRRAWYVRQRGQVAGPFRSTQIRTLAAQGKIGPQTELSVCEAGHEPEAWFAAKTVPDLNFLADETLLPPEALRGGSGSPATPPGPQPPPLPTGQITSRRRWQFPRHAALPLFFIMVAFCSGYFQCDPGPFLPHRAGRDRKPPFPKLGNLPPVGSFSKKPLTAEQIVAQAEHAVVRVQGLISSGSGFYVAENWIVTNAHVLEVEFAENLRVDFPSQTQRPPAANLQLRYIDYERDLAILQTDTRRKPLRLADGAAFHRGEDVVVIGSPTVSSLFVLDNAVSRGVVSSEATIDGQRFLQLGASVNPGNSGGPVLNSGGEVVGMVAGRANAEEALTFCIPADEIAQAIQRLQQGRPQALVQSWHRARVAAPTDNTPGDALMLPSQKRLLRLATAIHRFVQRSEEPQNGKSCDLPTVAWQQCVLLNRKLDRAQRLGWLLAAHRLRRDLQHRLHRLSVELRDRQARVSPSDDPTRSPTLRDIYGDLTALEAEFEGQTFDRKEHTLAVSTEPIELNDVYLGAFEISLNLDELATSADDCFRVVALDPHPAVRDDSVTHPHVQGETLCAGDARHAIRRSLQDGRLLDFYLLVASVLRTYNPGSPYVSLAEWEGVRCEDCDSTVDEGHAYSCEGCQVQVCHQCRYECAACEDASCGECSASCESCDAKLCTTCLKSCSHCGEHFCSGYALRIAQHEEILIYRDVPLTARIIHRQFHYLHKLPFVGRICRKIPRSNRCGHCSCATFQLQYFLNLNSLLEVPSAISSFVKYVIMP